MSLCHKNCLLRDIYRITMGQLSNLNQVRFDLEDYLYHEPAQLNNIVPKLWIISNKLRDKIAKARHLVFCIKQGCEVCNPGNGVLYNDE